VTGRGGSRREQLLDKLNTFITFPSKHGGLPAVQFPFFRNPTVEGGGWSAPRSGRINPKKDPVPIVVFSHTTQIIFPYLVSSDSVPQIMKPII